MLDSPRLDLDALVDVLKAAGEQTRMRLLALLASGDLTVTDLTDILRQSQPRISRHLKLLSEAGLVERYQEGAWAYFRLTSEGKRAALARLLVETVSPKDMLLSRDCERLAGVKRARAEKAQAYFSRNAASWDEIRGLHAPDERWRRRCVKLVGKRPFQSMLDLGTGTGRLLELFAALYRRGVGIDISREMLAVARANLDKAGISNAQVRQGDIFNRRRSSATASISSPSTRCCTISTIPRGHPRGGAVAEAGRAAGHRRFRAPCAGVPARGACPCAARLFRPADGRLACRSRARSGRSQEFRAARQARKRSLTVSNSGLAATGAC